METMKKVYLTIDDSPSKEFRVKMLYLHQKKIPAIFFCNGEQLERYEADMIDAVTKGFIIGNHSYRHLHFSDLSLDECKASIKITDDIIETIYQRSGIERIYKFFRFPYFDRGGDPNSNAYHEKWSKPTDEWFIYEREEKKEAIQSFLRELGYIQPSFVGINLKFFTDKKMLENVDVRCTFDQMEFYLGQADAPWGMGSEEAIIGRIDEDVPYIGRSLNCLETADIILVHDDEHTTDLFFRIIDRYIEKGFVFLTC